MGTVTAGHRFEISHRAGTPEDPNLVSADDIAAYMLIDSVAISTATSKAVSTVNAAAPDSTSISQANSRATSAGTSASTADSKAVSGSGPTSVADSKALSVSGSTSIADSKATSVATATPTLTVVAASQSVSIADSKAVSVATAVALPAQVPTGRTATTLTTYLANNALVFNIKDGFGGVAGALCDGSTNDSAAIKAAVDAAIAAGGGIIQFPAGTTIGYARAGANSKIIFRGMGSGVTTLKQPAATLRTVTDAAMTNGSATLTSATGGFTALDIGKTVLVKNAITGADLVGEILSPILSGTQVTLSVAANATVSGQTARIGTGRNVVEINDGFRGNAASAISGCGVVGMTLDGNKAGVTAPQDSGDDLINHGVLITACSNWVLDDVRAINCHNTGEDVVIASNYGMATKVYAESCGNALTGMPGFDVNSSSYCQFDVTTYLCYSGSRLLDNCFGNAGRFVNRRATSYGFLMLNQSANVSTGNDLTAIALECDQGNIAGAIFIGLNCHANTLRLMAEYAGGTYAVSGSTDTVTSLYTSYGIRIGVTTYTDVQKPTGNDITAVARKNGGTGVLLQANRNRVRVTATENSYQSALGSYAVDVNGSYNDVTVVCHDTASKQRGVAVRAASGEVGTAATENVIDIPIPNPTSPLDDTGTKTYRKWKALTGSKTFDWASIASGTQTSTTVTVTGASLGDRVVGVSMNLDLQGMFPWGYVSAADTVTVFMRNATGGPIDLASGTLTVDVQK